MKKFALLLVGMLLIGLAAGCIEKEESKTSTTSTTRISSTTSTITQTETTPTIEQEQPEQTVKKVYTREELIKKLEEIKRFTFLENTSVTFDVKVKQGNLTFNAGEVNIITKKVGYVDLENLEADINTTTTIFPGGASSLTREIIKDNSVYLYANGMWQKLSNETFGFSPELLINLTWKYNLVSFVKLYLQEEPQNVTMANETQVYYYTVKDEDLEEIVTLFMGIGNNANITFNVSNGILEITFKDGILYGGRVMYELEIRIKDVNAEVIEKGQEYDEFVIKDINVKKKVEEPKESVKA
jgi:uncharacterized protein (UPF0335 family)